MAADRAGRPGQSFNGVARSLFCRSCSTQTTKPTPLFPSRSLRNKHPPRSPADPNPTACALSPTQRCSRDSRDRCPVRAGVLSPGPLMCPLPALRAELRGAAGAGCAHLTCGHGRADGCTDGRTDASRSAPARHCCLHRDITAMSPRCHPALRLMAAVRSAGAEQWAAERLSLSFPYAALNRTKKL